MAATVRRPRAKIAPHSRTTAWAKVGRVKTTAKVCSKVTTSGPGMGGIALRDAGQASPPARKAPRAHTGPQKGQSRVGIAEESFFETKSTVLTNVGSKMMSVRRNG